MSFCLQRADTTSGFFAKPLDTSDTKDRRVCRATLTIGVDLAGHLEGLRGGHVRVGRRHCQDDAVGVGDVLQDQVSDLDLDVLGLVTDWHLEGIHPEGGAELMTQEPRLYSH